MSVLYPPWRTWRLAADFGCLTFAKGAVTTHFVYPSPEGGRPAAVFALVNKFTTQIQPWTWMTAWFCVPKILLSLKVNQLGDTGFMTLAR